MPQMTLSFNSLYEFELLSLFDCDFLSPKITTKNKENRLNI